MSLFCQGVLVRIRLTCCLWTNRTSCEGRSEPRTVGRAVGVLNMRAHRDAGVLVRPIWPVWMVRFVVASVVALAGAAELAAAEWNFKTVLRQEFQFDDNTRMLTDGAEPIWGLVSTPELSVSNRSPSTDIDFGAVLDINQFVGTGTKEEGEIGRASCRERV